MRTVFWTIMATLLVFTCVLPDKVSALELRMVGARGGVSDNTPKEDFTKYEIFGVWPLPWGRHLSSDWWLTPYLESSAGVLEGGGDGAFVGSLGLGVDLAGLDNKVHFTIGIDPTIIGRHVFGDEDLGGAFQFTSHIGIDVTIFRNFNLGYHFQHMSNSDFYGHNPGINMHLIGIGYRF